jgi:hypothetical protein
MKISSHVLTHHCDNLQRVYACNRCILTCAELVYWCWGCHAGVQGILLAVTRRMLLTWTSLTSSRQVIDWFCSQNAPHISTMSLCVCVCVCVMYARNNTVIQNFSMPMWVFAVWACMILTLALFAWYIFIWTITVILHHNSTWYVSFSRKRAFSQRMSTVVMCLVTHCYCAHTYTLYANTYVGAPLLQRTATVAMCVGHVSRMRRALA